MHGVKKSDIETEKIANISFTKRCFHMLNCISHFGDVVIRRVPGRCRGGYRLEGRAARIEFIEICFRHRRDAYTPTLIPDDKSTRLEVTKGLTNRRAADPEDIAYILLDQMGARLEFKINNLLFNRRSQLKAQRIR